MSKPWQHWQTSLHISGAYEIKVLFSIHSRFTDDCRLSKAVRFGQRLRNSGPSLSRAPLSQDLMQQRKKLTEGPAGPPAPSSPYPEILPQLAPCYVRSRFGRVQLFSTPVDCSLPGSPVREILQARMLEWKNMPSSRGSSRPRDGTCVSAGACSGRRVLYHQRHLPAAAPAEVLTPPDLLFLGGFLVTYLTLSLPPSDAYLTQMVLPQHTAAIAPLLHLGFRGRPCLISFSLGIKVHAETPQSLECNEFHPPWHAQVAQVISRLLLKLLFHVCSLELCMHEPPTCPRVEMSPFINRQGK